MLVWLVVSLDKPFVLVKFYCCVLLLCVCVGGGYKNHHTLFTNVIQKINSNVMDNVIIVCVQYMQIVGLFHDGSQTYGKN